METAYHVGIHVIFRFLRIFRICTMSSNARKLGRKDVRKINPTSPESEDEGEKNEREEEVEERAREG